MVEAVWLDPPSHSIPPDLLRLAGNSPVAAAALVRRGFASPEKAAGFLDPNLYHLSVPTDLPDLERAVDRIIMAIRKSERVAVWGDFDVDGQTSTAILAGGLRSLGADVIHHIPVRASESHGVNLPGLKDLIGRGAALIITCDTGVSAFEAAEFCRASGVDLIITDHHSLPPELPPTLAVVNPRRLPEGHPARTLSGAGCAWFVLRETAERIGRPEESEKWLDLAALGQVADLVELTGDSRCLVQRGLALLRKGLRPGLAALAARAGLELVNATEDDISFTIAPRLNALGRLGDANEMVDFFTTSDPVLAGVTAARLDALNLRRKLLTDQVFTAASAQVEAGRLERSSSLLMLNHPLWPAGILGIAASRLVEAYGLPVILLSSPEGELARGSARSVDGIDITAAIAASAPLLAGFGGHPMAAGMSLEAENIPRFRRELERTILSGAAGQAKPPVLQIDAWLGLPEITLELARQIEILAPFGPGNPALLFASRGLTVSSRRILGRPGDHLQVTIADDAGNTSKVMFWNGSGQPLPEGKFDLAFHLRVSNYPGDPHAQAEWAVWRPAEGLAPFVSPVPTGPEWFDYREAADPFIELEKIVRAEKPLIWQEGAGVSPYPGEDRFHLSACNSLVIWTAPAGWNDLRLALEAANPRRVHLFALPAEPSSPADLLKRMIGLLRYAVEEYGGWISIEKIAGLTALPTAAVEMGLDLILSKSLFRLSEAGRERMRFEKGSAGDSTENRELEEDFIRLAAEVKAFRELFRQIPIAQISAQ